MTLNVSSVLAATRASETAVDMYADSLTTALFLATAVSGQPGVVYKLKADTLIPYGLVRLGIRGGRPEVCVVALAELCPRPGPLRCPRAPCLWGDFDALSLWATRCGGGGCHGDMFTF